MHPSASMYSFLLQLLMLSCVPAVLGRNQSFTSLASEMFDCKHVKAGKGFEFDLSGLPPVTITNTEPTPPSKTTTSIDIRLCESLDRGSGPEGDQCPPGTRVCLKISNEKNGDDRLIQVIGTGGSDKGELVWSTELGKQLEGSERALELEMHGSLYAQQTQKTEINFICDSKADTNSKPTMKSYDKGDGELKLEWVTPHACATSFGGGSKDSDKKDTKNGSTPPAQSSSGWGFFSWFFFLIFLGGLVYFGLGFWRNYNEYGVIELPNKDFWREAPYIAKDMGKHIYSTVSGQGTSRGSYEPV